VTFSQWAELPDGSLADVLCAQSRVFMPAQGYDVEYNRGHGNVNGDRSCFAIIVVVDQVLVRPRDVQPENTLFGVSEGGNPKLEYTS
jgi:hypothetical protein